MKKCEHKNTVLKSKHYQQYIECKDCGRALHTVYQQGREVRLTSNELRAAQSHKEGK